MEGYKPQDFSFFHRSEKLVQRKVSLSNQWLCAISAMVVVLFVALILICLPENNIGEILQMLALFALTYWSYLGYTKFYRRFTLENLMSLLVCKDLDEGGRK